MATHFASVMVVDDNADIREAICGVLEAEGYTALSVEHGQQALDLIDQGRRPCVVLLDLMMPVMSGWEFMKAVNQKHDLDDLPIVVVSAFSEQPAEGARRVLKKPLDIDQ